MKGQEFVINQSNHSFIRTIVSPAAHHSDMDLPLLLMCLATERGIATKSVDHWYKSQQVMFTIKDEFLELPLICASETGGG